MTPGQVTGLTGIPQNTQVSLYWNPVVGATSYQVNRSTTSGSESVIATGLSDVTYIDSGLLNNITYFYTVSAVFGTLVGPQSAEISVIPVLSGTTYSGAIDPAFRTIVAQTFINDVTNNSYYMMIGDVTSWPNEADPTVAQSYVADVYNVWRNAYAALLIAGTNLIQCVPAINWTSGTVYTQYDAVNPKYKNGQFYVINSSNQVYKCLSNYGGVPSTVMPTATTANASFATSDNYRWKYMYTLTTGQAFTFLKNGFMPVVNASSNNIPAGSLESYTVSFGGSGYLIAPSVTIIGDGTGATAQAYISGGVLTHIEPTAVGNGYTWYKVQIGAPPAGGTQATAYANLAPVGGHGSNNIAELLARYVMFSVSLQGSESGFFSVANDYRVISIVRNPIDSNTSATATNTAYTISELLQLSSYTGSFQVDEIITGPSNESAQVIEWDPSGTYTGTLVGSGTLTAGSTGFTIFSGYNVPVPLAGSNVTLLDSSDGNTETKAIITATTTPTTGGNDTAVTVSALANNYLYASTTASWAASALYVNNVQNTLSSTQTVTGTQSTATGVIQNVIPSGLKLFSGSLFFYENIPPVQRNANQQEQVVLVFKF